MRYLAPAVGESHDMLILREASESIAPARHMYIPSLSPARLLVYLAECRCVSGHQYPRSRASPGSPSSRACSRQTSSQRDAPAGIARCSKAARTTQVPNSGEPVHHIRQAITVGVPYDGAHGGKGTLAWSTPRLALANALNLMEASL